MSFAWRVCAIHSSGTAGVWRFDLGVGTASKKDVVKIYKPVNVFPTFSRVLKKSANRSRQATLVFIA